MRLRRTPTVRGSGLRSNQPYHRGMTVSMGRGGQWHCIASRREFERFLRRWRKHMRTGLFMEFSHGGRRYLLNPRQIHWVQFQP